MGAFVAGRCTRCGAGAHSTSRAVGASLTETCRRHASLYLVLAPRGERHRQVRAAPPAPDRQRLAVPLAGLRTCCIVAGVVVAHALVGYCETSLGVQVFFIAVE